MNSASNVIGAVQWFDGRNGCMYSQRDNGNEVFVHKVCSVVHKVVHKLWPVPKIRGGMGGVEPYIVQEVAG